MNRPSEMRVLFSDGLSIANWSVLPTDTDASGFSNFLVVNVASFSS